MQFCPASDSEVVKLLPPVKYSGKKSLGGQMPQMAHGLDAQHPRKGGVAVWADVGGAAYGAGEAEVGEGVDGHWDSSCGGWVRWKERRSPCLLLMMMLSRFSPPDGVSLVEVVGDGI